MKQEMQAWRDFLFEEESLPSQEQVGKKLAKKAVRNINKLSQEDKDALEKLQKLLPALVMSAADAPEINEPMGESRSSRRRAYKKFKTAARREKLLTTAGLPANAKLKDLNSKQKAMYAAAKKEIQNDKYMSIQGDGGQTSLLLTKLDELPGVRKIPGITAALTTLFQTNDLTILSAIEALSSITGPLGI